MKLKIADRTDRYEKVAFVGNYLPRRCGIATFTTDLCESLAREAPEIGCLAVAMNDKPEGYRYPERVRFEVRQNEPNDYRRVADFLNMSQVGIVCLQHEYGIFGGPAGSHILSLLRELQTPVVTTLHTVLKNPDEQQLYVMKEICKRSERIVVMGKRAIEFLTEVYQVPEEKIDFIHHGIPDVPFIDPNFYKDQFGVEGRRVLLTFGLISPNKGIEYMIEALPKIIAKHPDVVYIVLGATHPQVKKVYGEEYRLRLQRKVRELGVHEHVIFHNRFVELEELCEFIGTADIYVTPYLNEAQVVSGTLAYSLGAGKAIISTPYWYAQEILGDGRGRLVPFRDSDQLAEQVIELLDKEVERHSMRKKAYNFGRQMIWKEVVKCYLKSFDLAREMRGRAHHGVFVAKTVDPLQIELPEIDLRHLKVLSDNTGIIQHATYTVPNLKEGYTTDDNARALIVAVLAQNTMDDDPALRRLAARYLAFLHFAFNEQTGRFHNFLSYDRKWLDEEGSEDSHGRALWGLGSAVGYSKDPGITAVALNLFDRALPAAEHLHHIRAWAFAIVGIHAYLRRFGGDSEARRVRETLANRLFEKFESNVEDDWPWPEDFLTYANAKLPHALLLSGQWMQRGDMVDMGLRCLDWLTKVQTAPNGHFSPIGNQGWYQRGGERAWFDQQPIEAYSTLSACLEAYNVTRDKRWRFEARRAFDWFLGQNDLGIPLYDYTTGGCRDGLHPDRANENQGAESTLVWLLSLLEMRLSESTVRE